VTPGRRVAACTKGAAPARRCRRGGAPSMVDQTGDAFRTGRERLCRTIASVTP
jgi:hypothetical protein